MFFSGHDNISTVFQFNIRLNINFYKYIHYLIPLIKRILPKNSYKIYIIKRLVNVIVCEKKSNIIT